MVVICYASDVMRCDRRRAELSNAPLHMTHDPTSIEKNTLKPSSILDLPIIHIATLIDLLTT